MKNFVQQLVREDAVYTLADSTNFSFVGSNLFTNADGSPVLVWCFWSTQSGAEASRKEDWSAYQVEAYSIATFIEDILVPMINEAHIVGIDFNENLEGIEVDPLDLLLYIVEEIKKEKITIELEYFKNLEDLETQARKLL